MKLYDVMQGRADSFYCSGKDQQIISISTTRAKQGADTKWSPRFTFHTRMELAYLYLFKKSINTLETFCVLTSEMEFIKWLIQLKSFRNSLTCCCTYTGNVFLFKAVSKDKYKFNTIQNMTWQFILFINEIVSDLYKHKKRQLTSSRFFHLIML